MGGPLSSLQYFLRPLQVQYAEQLPASLQKELHSAMFGVEVIHNFHLTFLEEVSAVVNTWSITSKLGAIFSQAVGDPWFHTDPQVFTRELCREVT